MQSKIVVSILCGLLVFSTKHVMASEAETPKHAGLAIELNSLKPTGSGCRIAFVIRNGFDVAIIDLGFELVMFDRSQSVLTVLSLEAGGLPKGKTRVKQFDIGKTDCKDVGRILLNDFVQCKGDGLDAAMCLKSVKLTSRAKIPFDF